MFSFKSLSETCDCNTVGRIDCPLLTEKNRVTVMALEDIFHASVELSSKIIIRRIERIAHKPTENHFAAKSHPGIFDHTAVPPLRPRHTGDFKTMRLRVIFTRY